MAEGIAFTLWAPLAAMGDIAPGERRSGFDRPARSAIFGLIAAALGLDRADEEAHAALERGWRLAQRVRAPGTLVEDYHTVQAPARDRKAHFATRREALQAEKIETLLSSRAYRADPIVDVVLIHIAVGGPAVEEVAAALRRPAYTLSFGRKSCPLGLPPLPVSFAGVGSLAESVARLDAAQTGPAQEVSSVLVRHGANATVYADADLAGNPRRNFPDMLRPDYVPIRVERRRDRVASRRRWQFELRDEVVARARPSATAPGSAQ